MDLTPSLVENLRTLNAIGAGIAAVLLLFFQALPYWAVWDVTTRIAWMALFLFCFTVSYGSFEVQNLDTNYRVPMATLSIIWVFVTALWPQGRTDFIRKRT